jgi:hypothetical protein
METVLGAIFLISALTSSQFTWGPYSPRADYDYPYRMPATTGRILFGAVGLGLLIIGIRNLLKLA